MWSLLRQADHERLELALRRTEAATEREREERARLEAELQEAIDGHAVIGSAFSMSKSPMYRRCVE